MPNHINDIVASMGWNKTLLKVRFISKKLYQTRFYVFAPYFLKEKLQIKYFLARGNWPFLQQTIYFKKNRIVSVFARFLQRFLISLKLVKNSYVQKTFVIII
jgi:hypothetical protein